MSIRTYIQNNVTKRGINRITLANRVVAVFGVPYKTASAGVSGCIRRGEITCAFSPDGAIEYACK